MNVSFSVAMMLQAVNNMGPGIQSAQRMIKGLGQSFQDVARQSSRLNPVQGWEERIYKVAEAAKKIGKELKESGSRLSERGEKIQHSGLKNVMEGAGLAAPALAMVSKAADLQMKQTSMRMSGISREGVGQLIGQADEYTKRTLFSKTEIADMFLSMRQSGMLEKNILRGSEPMVMLAELENIRRGTAGTETAKILAQMAERAGILQDPNIERWNEFLEIVNQVTTITTAGMHELHESSKYLEPVTRIAGWSEKDVMMSQGVAARFGLEGSIAGTDLKDMIQRLNPYKWLREEGNSSKALEAMERLGWLKDFESVPGRMGRKKYTHIGGSVMLNSDGSTVNMLEMFGQFSKAWERYKDMPNARALFQADMFKVLGEQGQKTALLVSQNYEVIQQMMEDAQKVKSIHEQINEYSKEYLQNYRAFKNSIENLEIDAGSLTLPSMTSAVETLRGWVAAAREFTAAHPGMVSGALKLLLAIGSLKVVIGLAQMGFGTLLTTFGGGKKALGWVADGIGWVGTRTLGMINAFQYFRGKGAGIFEALWKGAQWAFPWLQRILVLFTGPFGLAILALTAIIGVAVWAWNTNFMGFRDKAQEVWDDIKDYAEFVLPKISFAMSSTVEFMKRDWDDFKTYSEFILNGIDNNFRPTVKSWASHFTWFADMTEANWKRIGNIAAAVLKLTPAGWFISSQYEGLQKYKQQKEDAMRSIKGDKPRSESTFSQINNITLSTPKEAADFVQNARPPKYDNPEYNPTW